jgi:uncharacterized membrane protein YqhA
VRNFEFTSIALLQKLSIRAAPVAKGVGYRTGFYSAGLQVSCKSGFLLALRYCLDMRKILGLTRYAVFIPALASIIGALLLMAQGSIAVLAAAYNSVVGASYLKETIVEVLTAVDAILLGTVLLVIGYGLYELFIDADLDVPMWLRVDDLDDLKSKLIGVIVAIIAVVFVGVFVDANRADDVVSYGLGAGALVAGLALFSLATKKNPGSKKGSAS